MPSPHTPSLRRRIAAPALSLSLLWLAPCAPAAAADGHGATASATATGADAPQAVLGAIADAVDPQALHATLEKLVGFGTRHTLSDTVSPTRGIGAARRWTQTRFEAIARDCGGCLQVVTPAQTVTGKRIPTPAAW